MIVWRINDVEILLIGFLYIHHRKKDNINLELHTAFNTAWRGPRNYYL